MRVGERFIPHRRFHAIIIPLLLLRAKIVSHGAALCWGVLAYHAGKRGECYPLQETIGEELGVSVESTKRYLCELRDGRLIEIETRSLGRLRRNYYHFLWHSVFNDDRSKTTSRQESDSGSDSTCRQDGDNGSDSTSRNPTDEGSDSTCHQSTTGQIRHAQQVENDTRVGSTLTPPIKEEETYSREPMKREDTSPAEKSLLTAAEIAPPSWDKAFAALIADVATAIHAAHPAVHRDCSANHVAKCLTAICKKGTREVRVRTLEAVGRGHAAWCECGQWSDNFGKYANGLMNFLAPTMRRWESAPPQTLFDGSKPTRSEIEFAKSVALLEAMNRERRKG